MNRRLIIGTKVDGSPMWLPEDLTDKKIAMLAQSKKGKTYAIGDILEEMAKFQQPFIATDPADNLWGLRVMPDGTPSGIEVVIIGGSHADLPIEKDQGARMAELLLATPICAIIDITSEMPNIVRHFMTGFAQQLMRFKPDIGRLIVLEEAPELIPQKTMGVQAAICRDAVAKLAVIGGNFGYGVLAASQRAATMDKNVLSQCEALIVMGMTHEKDRSTVKGWIDAKDEDGKALEAFATLGSLGPGEAWLWWPSENRFERFTFRKRVTLHPREMRKLGLKPGSVRLGNMTTFVEQARRELTKTVVTVHAAPAAKNPKTFKALKEMGNLISKSMRKPIYDTEPVPAVEDHQAKIIKDQNEEIEQLKTSLAAARSAVDDSVARLMAVRDYYRPQYEALKKLFETAPMEGAVSPVNRGPYEIWFKNAPREGMKKMLSYLLEKRSATVAQLGTIAGVSPRSTSNYVAWLKRNKIALMQGGKLVLQEV